jgi:hydroxyacylglutathione hydrolase
MLKVLPIPALRDNYIWVIHDNHAATVVDPGEAEPIVAWLTDRGMDLTAILITHHHGDHVAGVAPLVERYRCPVFGPGDEGIAQVSRPVGEGDRVELTAPAARLQVMSVPGHTRGHVAYYGHGHLFCGDTLFSCGCGRLFEGTASQMYRSLMRLAALPEDTQVCCAHEYTLANIGFAREVDPCNRELETWEEEALQRRRAGRPTLPVSLGRERRINPFLRCHTPELRRAAERWSGAELQDPVEVFAALREMKNRM